MQPEISYKSWYNPLIKNIREALEKTMKENNLPRSIAEKIFGDVLVFAAREGVFITSIRKEIDVELPPGAKLWNDNVVYCSSEGDSVNSK